LEAVFRLVVLRYLSSFSLLPDFDLFLVYVVIKLIFSSLSLITSFTLSSISLDLDRDLFLVPLVKLVYGCNVSALVSRFSFAKLYLFENSLSCNKN